MRTAHVSGQLEGLVTCCLYLPRSLSRSASQQPKQSREECSRKATALWGSPRRREREARERQQVTSPWSSTRQREAAHSASIRDTIRAPYNATSERDCVTSLQLCLHGTCPQKRTQAARSGERKWPRRSRQSLFREATRWTTGVLFPPNLEGSVTKIAHKS